MDQIIINVGEVVNTISEEGRSRLISLPLKVENYKGSGNTAIFDLDSLENFDGAAKVYTGEMIDAEKAKAQADVDAKEAAAEEARQVLATLNTI